MSNLDSAATQESLIKPLEYLAAWVVAFFALLFSAWTLGSHAATFFNIPWLYLSNGAIYLSLLLTYLAYKLSVRFAENYCSALENKPIALNPPSNLIFISLLIASAAIFLSSGYRTKFTIVAIGILAISLFSRSNKYTSIITQEKFNTKSNIPRDWGILLSLMVIAIMFSLGAHRPDLDDSSFIQIASQTLIHHDRAPLSYDASLGHVLESFRFAPYRISAYETLIALISEWSGINIFSIYYLVVPGVTSGLAILVAFIFSRWFLSTNGAAIMATAVFLLIMFAWGETHIAYGNRVFVRIFQGKGLIIALTTPFSIIAGLLLIRRPGFFNILMLAIANICAIGVSSSGLVMTIFTSLIICVAAITRDTRKLVYSCLLVAATMFYPALLAFWIKFQSKTGVPLSEVGTYLPINASLGLGYRESAALVALLLGYSVFISNQKKTYCLIIGSVILFILNPWLSEMMSVITSRNMSWRLAWAAPVPLLVSVSLVAALGVVMRKNPFELRVRAAVMRLVSIGLISLFVLSYRWVPSVDNNVTWGYPSAKLPDEFYSTNEIATKIRSLNINGDVLSHRDIAAWMPIALPGAGLVMPGHTYPIQLQTILSKHEFELRMKLFDAVNSNEPNLGLLAKEMRKLNVELIVLPNGIDPIGLSQSNKHQDKIAVVRIDSISGYSLYRLYYGDTSD